VAVKAANLEADCPFMCSGTPGATQGCVDGARDAKAQINRLLKERAATQVQAILQVTADTPDARAKLKPYFREGPVRLRAAD
jgi:hypothetical protein